MRTSSIALTHKERVLRALHYQPVDRIPTQVNYTQATWARSWPRISAFPVINCARCAGQPLAARGH